AGHEVVDDGLAVAGRGHVPLAEQVADGGDDPGVDERAVAARPPDEVVALPVADVAAGRDPGGGADAAGALFVRGRQRGHGGRPWSTAARYSSASERG